MFRSWIFVASVHAARVMEEGLSSEAQIEDPPENQFTTNYDSDAYAKQDGDVEPVAPVISDFSAWNIQNPVPFTMTGTVGGDAPLVFDIIEIPKSGKLANYEIFYLGSLAAPAAFPHEVYKHRNGAMEMNVDLKNLQGKKIARWVSGQTGTGGRSGMSHRAYLTGPRGKKETYYTLRALSQLGARREAQAGQLGNLMFRGGVETFVADAGVCPKKKKCGRRVMMAQGHRMANWMRFYEPCTGCPPGARGCNPLANTGCNRQPIGTMVKVGSRPNFKVGGRAEIFRLTVQPGSDLFVMLNMATFIDTSNNIEGTRERVARFFR